MTKFDPAKTAASLFLALLTSTLLIGTAVGPAVLA